MLFSELAGHHTSNANAGIPISTARSTNFSGCDAPWRKEKALALCSST